MVSDTYLLCCIGVMIVRTQYFHNKVSNDSVKGVFHYYEMAPESEAPFNFTELYCLAVMPVTLLFWFILTILILLFTAAVGSCFQ